MNARQVKRRRRYISTRGYYRDRAIDIAEELADLQVDSRLALKANDGHRALRLQSRMSRLHQKLNWYMDRL